MEHPITSQKLLWWHSGYSFVSTFLKEIKESRIGAGRVKVPFE